MSQPYPTTGYPPTDYPTTMYHPGQYAESQQPPMAYSQPAEQQQSMGGKLQSMWKKFKVGGPSALFGGEKQEEPHHYVPRSEWAGGKALPVGASIIGCSDAS